MDQRSGEVLNTISKTSKPGAQQNRINLPQMVENAAAAIVVAAGVP